MTKASKLRQSISELELTASMLEKWAPDLFPDKPGQIQLGRCMMESAAGAIRAAIALGKPAKQPAKNIADNAQKFNGISVVGLGETGQKTGRGGEL